MSVHAELTVQIEESDPKWVLEASLWAAARRSYLEYKEARVAVHHMRERPERPTELNAEKRNWLALGSADGSALRKRAFAEALLGEVQSFSTFDLQIRSFLRDSGTMAAFKSAQSL
jgi:hypothetical protein